MLPLIKITVNLTNKHIVPGGIFRFKLLAWLGRGNLRMDLSSWLAGLASQLGSRKFDLGAFCSGSDRLRMLTLSSKQIFKGTLLGILRPVGARGVR